MTRRNFYEAVLLRVIVQDFMNMPDVTVSASTIHHQQKVGRHNTIYTQTLKSTNFGGPCLITMGRHWIRKLNKLTKNFAIPMGTQMFKEI